MRHLGRHLDLVAKQKERAARHDSCNSQQQNGQPGIDGVHARSFFLSIHVSTAMAAVMPTSTAASRPRRYGKFAAATATTPATATPTNAAILMVSGMVIANKA